MSKSILSVNGNKAMNYLLKTILEKDYQFVPANDVFHGMYQLRTNKQISILVIDLLILGWCYFDSVERNRTLGAWFRVLIVLFGIIALFVYLIKSRGIKHGLFSIGKALLFCVGMIVIMAASAFVVAVLLGIQ